MKKNKKNHWATEILEILLIAYNVLIINVNYEDRMAKETN